MKYVIHETVVYGERHAVGCGPCGDEFEPQVPPPEGGEYKILHKFDVSTPHQWLEKYYSKPSAVRASGYFNEYMGYGLYQPYVENPDDDEIMVLTSEAKAGRDKCKAEGNSGLGRIHGLIPHCS